MGGKLSPDSLMERETIIRWDELNNIAHLWTASPSIRKEWEAHQFPIVKDGGGWGCEVPRDRLFYRNFKKTSNNS